MTIREASTNLNTACDLLFQVEIAVSKDDKDYIRLHGYRARLAIQKFQNILMNCKREDISKRKCDI